MEVGKSTLLGVLTHGETDNGRGRARLDLFRHLHEMKSGRTSSISQEILGFDCAGNVRNFLKKKYFLKVTKSNRLSIFLVYSCKTEGIVQICW